MPVRRSLAVLICACVWTIGCASIEPGDVSDVAPISSNGRARARTRAGNVYLLRGFIGIFSAGIDRLGEEVNEAGVHATVFQDDQWSAVADAIGKKYEHVTDPEPLVLIGHSYGADDAIRIARELKRRNVRVDLLVTLDPVTPPTVPSNVQRCVNLYESNGLWDTLPWLRGVPLERERSATTQLVNNNLRTDRPDLLEPNLDHFNIEKKQKVHQEVLKYVLLTCTSRANWTHRISSQTSVAARPDASRSLMTPLKKPAPAPSISLDPRLASYRPD
jgi:pimeloyl-ACP methyl ester carboxylesterase